MSAVPFKVKAVFEYKSEEPDDLNFPNGQVITVVSEEDEGWYTGEYTNAAGDKLEGMFPRNFVEKYEPASPSRPSRAPKKVAAPEPPPEPAVVHDEPTWTHHPESVGEVEVEPPHKNVQPSLPATTTATPSSPPAAPALAAAKPVPPHTTAAVKPGPPPVADKPSSSSFKDRIAAFNKPAASPVAPFKPGGQGSTSGFIKKPFVAPPPSKNAYVPPPREPPPQKIYRREEDPSLHNEEEHEAPEPSQSEEIAEDQPKPTSLKERIALLQKQQLEQAARHAETALKKEKPKKPPKKRVDLSEEAEVPHEEGHLETVDTNETVGKKPVEASEDASDVTRSPPARQQSIQMPTPLPPRELVSDTNDADDSGAADTEDAPGTSTEEDRPRSKDLNAAISQAPVSARKEPIIEPAQQVPHKDKPDENEGEEEDEEEEEEEEEEEDPEVRRRRELRDRMARLGGGVGMMGMFGPPGGMPAPAPSRKPRQSTEAQRQSSEQHDHEAVARAPPVPMVALPGMSNQFPKRTEEHVDPESDEEDTAQTPHDLRKETEASEDYVSQPPKRSATGHSSSGLPQESAGNPTPPREVRAPPPPPPTEARAVPLVPQSPLARSIPPPPPPTKVAEDEVAKNEDEDVPQPPRRSEDVPTSPTNVPPLLPPSKSRPEPTKPQATTRELPQSPVSSPHSRPPPPPPPGQLPSRRSTSDSHAMTGARADVDDDSEAEVTEYDGDYDTDIASSAKHKDALKSHNRDSSFDDGVLTDDATKSPASPPARAVPPLPPVSAPRDVPPPPPPGAPKSRKSTDAPRAPPPVPPPTHVNNEEEEYDPFRYSAPQHGLSSPGIQGRQGPILSSPREELEEEDMYGASVQPPRMPPPPPSERAAPPPPLAEASIPDQPKQSTDVKRSMTLPRRSIEQQQRPIGDQGSIASDLDLGRSSFWWTQDNLPPPSLQQRTDVLFEMDTSTSTKRGGQTTISKVIYVLYTDYSRTTITASFDSADPSHVTLSQTHDRPPPPPRKDQLESASEQYGSRIAAAASSAGAQGITVGDGAPQSLVLELLRPLTGALRPIGTRSYGALVYANLANASTQQHDEIRAGDIVTFRNAKFVGHRGTMHQKYSVDVGKPDHVGVVIDWDGTKKKIRAWEQVSREEKGKKNKVKEESFKVGDLKSGEVRVWRVMGREWVGWDQS